MLVRRVFFFRRKHISEFRSNLRQIYYPFNHRCPNLRKTKANVVFPASPGQRCLQHPDSADCEIHNPIHVDWETLFSLKHTWIGLRISLAADSCRLSNPVFIMNVSLVCIFFFLQVVVCMSLWNFSFCVGFLISYFNFHYQLSVMISFLGFSPEVFSFCRARVCKNKCQLETLLSNISAVKVNFAGRDANTVAHFLFKWALRPSFKGSLTLCVILLSQMGSLTSVFWTFVSCFF